MRIPGFTAEASLFRPSSHYGHEKNINFLELSSVVPQQLEHPGFTISCSPCLPRFITQFGVRRLVWRESVRTCVYRQDFTHPEGGHYICGPCLERSCSPFVAVDRFNFSLP